MFRKDNVMEVMDVLAVYTDELKKLYEDHLRTVILYGSYARGDYGPDSDIDIMILLDLDEEEISRYSGRLSDMTFDCNYENGVAIMPIAKSQTHFKKWINAYPFYNSIANEGIELYAA